MLRGLDASSVQGLLPVTKIGDLKFAILKAQQGNDGFDPFFERNMRACLAAGIEVFAYCFAYPLPPGTKVDGSPIFGRDPKEQAKICVDRVYRFPEMHGRPLFLDLEWPEPTEWTKWGCTAKQIAAWCREFCSEVYRLTGVRPVIYTYPWWWASVTVGGDVAWASDYGLWLAAYTNKWPSMGDSPKIPKPWKTWLFWQFDGNGGLKLPNGVDSDFCVFNGDATALHAFAYQKPTVPELTGNVEPTEGDGPIIHPKVEF